MNFTFRIYSTSCRAKASTKEEQLSDTELKIDGAEIIGVETVDEWDELYACECCDQVFTNSTGLMEHREIHAEINEDHTKYMEDSG